MYKRYFVLSVSIVFFIQASAQFKLDNLLSSNMVIQRDQPIKLRGIALPGQIVSATILNEKRTIVTKADSTWELIFKRQSAKARPQSIMISCGNEKILLTNILIGDVWICAGQSNMEWPMIKEMHWQDEMKRINQPLIRLNNPRPSTHDLRQIGERNNFYQWSSWDTCAITTVQDMSAVAYYFAKNIVSQTNIPIGLINIAIGGAPIETFVSREAMQDSKKFVSKLSGNWVTNNDLPVWARGRGNEMPKSNDPSGPSHLFKPGFAFAAGIKPLMSFEVKGLIWYQGETNAMEIERVNEYGDLFQLMIKDYKKQWPDLATYWVQLSSVDTAYYQSKYWPQFRNEQRKLLNHISNGGMAVSSDIGMRDNVHPSNKKDVGERLARWALYKTYAKPVVPSGPLPVNAKYSNGAVVVTFRFAKGLKSRDDMTIHGFSLDGLNEVVANVKDYKIIIATGVKPTNIYYSWKANADGNLINAEGLPASTFKIDVQ